MTFVEGTVEVRRPDSGWKPLYVGEYVMPKDVLRSGDGGRTEVSFGNPRRVLRIERGSVVALGGRPAGDRLVLVSARIDQGVMWAKVSGGRNFTVASPTITSRFNAAKLAVRVDEESERLAVYQGSVEVNGHSLQGGEGLLTSGGQSDLFEVSNDDDLRDGWRDIVQEALTASDKVDSDVPQTQRLTRDLRDLNPEIYLGVEVELTGTAAEATGFAAEAARIRKIRVKASKWDVMEADHKVDLLNDTFDVLKGRYPGILETVVLEFDDNRPRLSLKYAAAG